MLEIIFGLNFQDRLCGLVVRFPGHRSRGSGSISGATRFFLEVTGVERCPLSLVSTIEKPLERKSTGSGLGSQDYDRRGSAALTKRQPSIHKSLH
jgi:hypothetical protein